MTKHKYLSSCEYVYNLITLLQKVKVCGEWFYHEGWFKDKRSTDACVKFKAHMKRVRSE
jgi:hypothetical protein